MNENAVRALWKWLAPTVFIGGLSAWAHAVGVSISNPLGVGYTQAAGVLFSLPSFALLLVLTYWLAGEYASTKLHQTWQHRIPLYFLDPKDVTLSSKGGTLVQGVAFLSFYIIPLLCLAVLWIQFQKRGIYCNFPEGLVASSASLFPMTARPCETFLRYADQGGPQYYQWASPWCYLTLMLIAFAAWLRALIMLFRR